MDAVTGIGRVRMVSVLYNTPIFLFYSDSSYESDDENGPPFRMVKLVPKSHTNDTYTLQPP